MACSKMRGVGMTACMVVGTAGLPALAAQGLDEGFEPGKPDAAWKLEFQSPEQAAIRWPGAGEKPGLAVHSKGIAKFERPIDPITGPMEFFVELALDKGQSETWRNNGLAVVLSSAPVDQMANADWSVVFQAIQQGAIATVKQGGARWAGLRPNDTRNIMQYQGGDIAPRFTLTMAGAGGKDYSVPWPSKYLNGVNLRFHAWRDDAGMMRLTIHHSGAPGGPWWTAEAPLPKAGDKAVKGWEDRPLKYVTVYISQEASKYGEIAKASAGPSGQSGDGRGDGLFAGRITAIKVGPLQGDQPQWNQTFPAEPIEGEVRAKGTPSAWLPKGGIAQLRQKFNDPMFANYKAVILANAGKQTQGEGGKGDIFDVMARTWAYVLTGEREHFDAVVRAIRGQVGIINGQPGPGSPGSVRQLLDVSEFQVHRYESLAQAYDLLYDELAPDLRMDMRRAMLRSLDHYIRQTDAKDWWYVNNPSNTIGVGNGCNALIAMALRHEHPELAKTVVDRAVTLIHKKYVGVANDGGCNEGNMYWNYGMSYPLMLGWVLRNAEGDDRGLLNNPKIRNAHRYVETNMGGDGLMIPFNDTQPWINGLVPMAAASSEFDQPLMRWMCDHLMAKAAEQPLAKEQIRGPYAVAGFLFRDTTPAPSEFPGMPTISHLESINEGVLRSDGTFIPRMVVGIKGNGTQNTHHANTDQGSFVFYARGEVLLLDPGYFEDGPDKHSNLVIGEPAKGKWNPKAFAPIQDAWEAGDLRSMAVDATEAQKDAKRARRVFVAVGDEALVVLDDVEPKQAGTTLTAFFQASGQEVKVGDTGPFTIVGKQGAVTVQFDGPAASLTTTPREFKKWVYQTLGYPWKTVALSYPHDAAQPGVHVLLAHEPSATAGAASVQRADGRITVKLPSGKSVSFAHTDGRWQAAQN